MSYRSLTRPCADCPFRKDAPRDAWLPERFQALYRTASGDHLNLFGCHHSTPRRFSACAGWRAVVGPARSLGLRRLLLDGIETPDVDTSGLDLFGSFEEMLAANGVNLGIVGPCCHCHRRDAGLVIRQVPRLLPKGSPGWHCGCGAGPGAVAVLCRDCTRKKPVWVCKGEPTNEERRLAQALPLLRHAAGCPEAR